jgi:hypothetical protein
MRSVGAVSVEYPQAHVGSTELKHVAALTKARRSTN